MKRKLTLKSLLVAGLMTVGVTTALADGNRRDLCLQNYETATATDWISKSAECEFKTNDAIYGNYAQMWASGSGNRAAYKKVSLAFVPDGSATLDMAVEGYNIEFDMQLRSGNVKERSVSQFFIATVEGGNLNGQNAVYEGSDFLFSLTQRQRDAASNDNVWYINDIDNGESAKTVTLDNSKWYHFSFVLTASSVKYTISLPGNEDPVATGSKEVTALPVVTGFSTLIGRGNGLLNFDNLEIYDFTETKTANAPTFTLKAVSGENRVYSIANTNTDGTIYYTTAPAESAPSIGNTAYSSSSGAIKDVTFSKGGKYYAYVVLSDETTTSTVTEVEVEVGEITLPTPTYAITALDGGYSKSYTIYASNDVLLSPELTVTYVFTPAGGVAEAPVVMSGNIINATEEGTYVVTSSADGYTSSNVTIENNTAYKLVKTIDFTSLTASDFDDKWTPSNGGLDARWTSNASAIPNDATYYALNDPANDGGSALEGITVTNPAQRQPQVYIGYGLFTPYATLSGNGNNLNLTVNDATDEQLAVYQGWNNYGRGTFTTVQVGTATFSLYRTDTMLKTIKLFEPMAAEEEFEVVSVGTDGFATFSCDKALDFSSTTIKAYIAQSVSDGKVMMQKVEKVPANTGLFLTGTEGEIVNENVPVATTTEDVIGNLLIPTTGEELEAGNFVFAKDNGKYGFFKLTKATEVPAGKAYISSSIAFGRLAIVFEEGEATGIAEIRAVKDAEDVYNLAGQRVVKAQKGLYIQNGKKYLVK